MRFRCAMVLLIGSALVSFAGNLAPLTVKDISLMLRSGYSSDSVQREIASRRAMEPLDASAEKNLLQAGASPALIAALKSGAYAIAPSQVDAVKADLAAKAQRRAAQAEESRKLDTVYQSHVAEARAASPSTPTANAIAPLVKGDLVSSKNGVLSPYLDQTFEKKKLVGLYFSAHWCPPCRKFTPELVAFYNRNAAAHPEFEIVFVSSDKSAAAMEAYMRDMQMPWPAVSFDKLRGKDGLRKYAGSGIPCLVVVDGTGKVISDSYAGTIYRGPAAVLADLDRVFAANSGAQLALQR
jgi:nucleoredoxin